MKTYRVKLFTYSTSKWNSETKKVDTVEPYLIECLGSDNWFSLDARLSLDNLKRSARNRISKMLKNVVYYEIYQGYNGQRISDMEEQGKVITSEYI